MIPSQKSHIAGQTTSELTLQDAENLDEPERNEQETWLIIFGTHQMHNFIIAGSSTKKTNNFEKLRVQCMQQLAKDKDSEDSWISLPPIFQAWNGKRNLEGVRTSQKVSRLPKKNACASYIPTQMQNKLHNRKIDEIFYVLCLK